MEALAAIGGMPGAGGWGRVYGTGSALPAQSAPGMEAGAALAASQSALSASSISMTAATQSLVATSGAAPSSNELLGAVMLMLILEYLKTDDEQEKTGLLALISMLAQQQQQGAGGSTLMYSSSYLSIESTQLQFASTDMAVSAYTGATATLQQAPGVDPGAGGLDVVA